jgi:hypothetical protein
MKSTKSAIIMTLACFIFLPRLAIAQTESMPHWLELSGSIAYDYSSYSSESRSSSAQYDVLERDHSLLVTPAIGYFVTKAFEAQLDINYWMYIVTDEPSPYNGENRIWSHRVGFLIGAAYNLPITSTLTIFASAKGGFTWIGQAADGPDQQYSLRWTNPSTTFPVLALGTKVFVSPDWALMTFARYQHIDSHQVTNNYITNQFSIGLGFAVYY